MIHRTRMLLLLTAGILVGPRAHSQSSEFISDTISVGVGVSDLD